MKPFNGKAIYQPKGKAAEYAAWACNFYVGCSNGCTYCYCKKGILAGAMGMDKPQLKKCFKDEEHAFETFTNEVEKNKEELRKHGLFFSFTTDPMIRETKRLTIRAVHFCNRMNIPVSVLTKETGYIYLLGMSSHFKIKKELIAVGFTLTGHDELEPNAASNAKRIRAMELCEEVGFHTFASIEPIIKFNDSLEMIKQANFNCDLFKIGLESGKKYSSQTIRDFIEDVTEWIDKSAKIYFKDSLLKAAVINRDELPENCVNRDYNLFNQR